MRVVLDNFGTGYSSLYHLRNFKLDKIKIDRSFIDTLGFQESARIVSALVGLARGLGLTIVADGVTEAGQLASLIGYRVRAGAGRLVDSGRFRRRKRRGCSGLCVRRGRVGVGLILVCGVG